MPLPYDCRVAAPAGARPMLFFRCSRILPVSLLIAASALTAHAGEDATAGHDDHRRATITALRKDGKFPEALQQVQAWLAHDPANTDAATLQVLVLADMGASEQAWSLMRRHPQRFAAHDRERIEGDRIAAHIRWGGTYAADGARQDDEATDALRLLRETEAARPRTTTWESTRIRVDALSALNQLQRHAEVAQGYQALVDEGVEVPAYILPTVGDSLLALRRPEAAVEVLQQSLRSGAGPISTHLLLAYAWVEQERFDLALPLLERLAAEQPAWPRRQGAPRGYENWDRYGVDMTRALVESYAQDNATAERSLRALLAIAPADSGLHAALASVESRRGRPTSALQHDVIALNLDPRSADACAGQVDALLALQRPGEAVDALDELRTQHPRDPRVRRIQRQLDIHRGWQATVEAGRARSQGGGDGTSASPLGSRDGSLQASLQSPLIRDRWRVALVGRDEWAALPEERVRYQAFGAGLRYRHDRLGVSADMLRSTDRFDTGLTLLLDIDWRFSDAWTGLAGARRNDPDASLQARQRGVTANTLQVAGRYTPSDTTRIEARLGQLRYSDGNHRLQAGVDAEQRLSSAPHTLIEGLFSVQTSRSEYRSPPAYFSPRRDAAALVGARLDHIGWRRYERSFRQLLEVTAGPYWQQGHGTGWVPSVAYRHRWAPVQGQQLGYGVTWSRPLYDGQRETRVALDLSWQWGAGQ